MVCCFICCFCFCAACCGNLEYFSGALRGEDPGEEDGDPPKRHLNCHVEDNSLIVDLPPKVVFHVERKTSLYYVSRQIICATSYVNVIMPPAKYLPRGRIQVESLFLPPKILATCNPAGIRPAYEYYEYYLLSCILLHQLHHNQPQPQRQHDDNIFLHLHRSIGIICKH